MEKKIRVKIYPPPQLSKSQNKGQNLKKGRVKIYPSKKGRVKIYPPPNSRNPKIRVKIYPLPQPNLGGGKF